MKNERNRSLMPELLRRQLFLSEEIESQLPGAVDGAQTLETMTKVLSRSPDWVDFYRENIDDLDVPASRLRENAEEDRALSLAGKHEVWFMTKLWDNDIGGAREELEPMVREVAVYDPMLAGWYSIWVGISYYAEGKIDAAIDMFDEARRRIGRSLPLPRRQIAEEGRIEPSRTMIEDALREVAAGEVGKINDRIAKLRLSTADAFSKVATHKQCEEAVRTIGSSLGFNSTRPCTDYGQGPDNLWIDVKTEKMIAFELKTDKSADAALSKEEIGQGLNHIEWLRKRFPKLELVGLIYLTDCHRTSEKGNPAANMYFGSQAAFRKLWDDFLIAVERIRPRTPMGRIIEAGKIGELPEWSCEGMFKRIAETKMA